MGQAGSNSQTAFRPELQRAAGAAQHVAMSSNGTLRMAQNSGGQPRLDHRPCGHSTR